MTKSVTAVAGMWFIRAIMRVPVQFFAGIIADKYNNRKVIAMMNFVSVPIAAAFLLSQHAPIYYTYFLVFLLQLTNDIEQASSMTILPKIVENEQLTDANSTFSVLGTIATLLSPGIAGIIYTLFGVTILYGINALSFMVAGILYLFMRYEDIGEKEEVPQKFTLFEYAKEGYSIIRNQTGVKIIFLGSISFAILGRFYDVYKVFVAEDTLRLEPESIVIFSYGMAIGSLIAPFIIKWIGARINDTMAFIIANIFTYIGFIIWAFSSHIILSTLALVIVGGFSTGISVFMRSILQKKISANVLGRVFSFYKITIILSAILGIMIAPLLYDFVGSSYAILLIGVIGIGVCISLATKSEEITSTDNLNELD